MITLAILVTLVVLTGAYWFVGFAFGRDQDRYVVNARWIKYPRTWKVQRW